MARSQKAKSKDGSIHSRAARRETSPSINVDKSILNTERADDRGKDAHESYSYSAGVSKKKRAKPMTRQQRLRQEKGMEKAAQNLEKLSKKVADSHLREKRIKTRNIPWDELNVKSTNAQQPASRMEKPTSALASGIVDEDVTDQVDVAETASVGSEVDEVL